MYQQEPSYEVEPRECIWCGNVPPGPDAVACSDECIASVEIADDIGRINRQIHAYEEAIDGCLAMAALYRSEGAGIERAWACTAQAAVYWRSIVALRREVEALRADLHAVGRKDSKEAAE